MPKKTKTSGMANQVTTVTAAARCGDHAEPAQEAAAVEAAPRGQHETDADQEEKRAGDQPREHPPAEAAGDVGGDEAEEAQVPREMVDDHRQDRDAARRVDERQAGRPARQRTAPCSRARPLRREVDQALCAWAWMRSRRAESLFSAET